jgi:hypothetical protein
VEAGGERVFEELGKEETCLKGCGKILLVLNTFSNTCRNGGNVSKSIVCPSGNSKSSRQSFFRVHGLRLFILAFSPARWVTPCTLS